MVIDATSVICITGASSGLGAACAVQYAQRGATIVLAARRADRLNEVAKRVREAGGTPHVIVADVAREEECQRVIDETIATFGGIAAWALVRSGCPHFERKLPETHPTSALSGFFPRPAREAPRA